MIPFILAIAGGYLIGDSMGDDGTMAHGGETLKNYKVTGTIVEEVGSKPPPEADREDYIDIERKKFTINVMASSKKEAAIIAEEQMKDKHLLNEYGSSFTGTKQYYSGSVEIDKVIETEKSFADGGTMWRVSPTTMEEDMKEAKELIGDDKWKAMSKSDRVKLTKYLKFKGDIGLPGQEEDIETVSGLQYYAKGGNVAYYDKDKEHRLGRPSASIDKEILEKVKYYAESGNFVGNFGWKLDKNSSSRQSLADGYLYKLDNYDESLVKSIKLKQGENIFRYLNRATAIGGMTPLIKINLDKGLLYFEQNRRPRLDFDWQEGDKVFFDAKGVKALWINIIQHKL